MVKKKYSLVIDSASDHESLEHSPN